MKKYIEEIFIVPNENILNVPIYHQEVKQGENHFTHVFKFIRKYNLNINFENIIPEEYVAGLGSIVIDIDRKGHQCFVFLPSYLSKKQIRFMNSFRTKNLLSDFGLNGFFAFGVFDSTFDRVDISPYVSNNKVCYETMREYITNYIKIEKNVRRIRKYLRNNDFGIDDEKNISDSDGYKLARKNKNQILR